MKKGKAKAAKKKEEFERMQAEKKAAKELKWRTGLMDVPEIEAPGDVKWQGLDAWKDHIEKTEEKKPKGKLALEAETRARKSLLNKVHDSVTANIMGTLTEICSQIMTGTEESVRAADDEIGAVVNALNGVIMTYHMGDKKRFLYLRRYASDKLTELISSILDECVDVSEKVTEINTKISDVVESKKGEASDLMNAKITEMLAASEEVDIPEGVPGSIDADSDAMKAQLADMIKSIGEQATRLAVEKMDTTTSKLIEVICKVIEQLAAAYEAAKGKGGMDGNGNLNQESIEALKEEVFGIVTGEYDNCVALVRNNVGGLIHFLDMLMVDDDGGDE